VPGRATYYVYKKELVQKMEASFSSESYVAEVGKSLVVTLLVTGGSGFNAGTAGTKPSYLNPVSHYAWGGISYATGTGTISAVITDTITGQQYAASADITITEKLDNSNDETNNPGGASDPTDPADSVDPADPADTSTSDTPDEPTTPSEPDGSTEPEEPTESDNPTGPTDTSTLDLPDDSSDFDSSDTPDSQDAPTNSDELVVVVPDSPVSVEEPVVVVPDAPDNPDTPNDQIVIIANPEPIEPGDGDNQEPIFVVIDNNESSDTDKIIVTDDGVTMLRPNNHDLAIFMAMFGAITGLNGSTAAPSDASMAVQKAQQRSKSHE
jgi:hypothetical protein